MVLDDYVLAFIMAGGRGERLKVLTRDRAKPAVGIIGKYRIFDFVASNVANSGIPAMMVATQFEPRSISTHIGNGESWGFNHSEKQLEIVHPHQGTEFVKFEGTADSVRKSMDTIDKHNPDIDLILGGDHIYSLSYRPAIMLHKEKGADITIMANAVPEYKVSDFGIMKIDDRGRILDFTEKPTDAAVIKEFRLTEKQKEMLKIRNPEATHIASIGNYVFHHNKLKSFLKQEGSDFGKHMIPAIKENGGLLYAYVFDGYWKDVGKIIDYFNCNMEFTNGKDPIDLIKARIRTALRQLPDVKIRSGAHVEASVLSIGDEIYKGTKLTNSVLGFQTIIEEYCSIDQCIFLGADRNEYYLNELRREYFTKIGSGTTMKKVILDKNVQIGRNVSLSPENGNVDERIKRLESTGLKHYNPKTNTGDFCFEGDILIIGKQWNLDKPMIPDDYRG